MNNAEVMTSMRVQYKLSLYRTAGFPATVKKLQKVRTKKIKHISNVIS